MAEEWEIGRAEQDELTVSSHREPRRRLRPRLPRRPPHPLPGPGARPEPAPRLERREAGEAEAGLRRRERDDDRRPTRPRSPTAPARCCSPARSGRKSAGCRSSPTSPTAQTAAVDHVHKREGLLMAPAYAMPRMLERYGAGIGDFDYYEIHEAFAAQVLCTLKAWEDAEYCKEKLGLDQPFGSIDRSKLNVNGGSLAAGHPFAATGGADRRRPRQAAPRRRQRTRRDQRLRRRRPGRRRGARGTRRNQLNERSLRTTRQRPRPLAGRRPARPAEAGPARTTALRRPAAEGQTALRAPPPAVASSDR